MIIISFYARIKYSFAPHLLYMYTFLCFHSFACTTNVKNAAIQELCGTGLLASYVMLMLLLTLFTLDFPSGMQDAQTAIKAGGLITFVFYCGVILFLLLLKYRTAATLSLVSTILKPFPARFSEKIIPLLGSFIGGIRLTSGKGHLLAIMTSSIFIWIFCVLPVDFTLRAFNIHLPVNVSMFIMVLLVFAVMVPASPGYIGTYHYACYKGLSVFSVPESTSLSIALILHAESFFPVILAGFYYLWKNRISLNKITDSK